MDLKPGSRNGEITIDANTIKAPTVKGAVWVAHGITGAMQFVDGDDRTVVSNIRIPIRFDKTISPTITICWSANGASPGNCEWQLEYLWMKDNESTIAPADAIITKVSAASAISDGMVMTIFTDIIIPDENDICFHIRVKRLAAGTIDTIANTVEVLHVQMRFAKKEGM